MLFLDDPEIVVAQTKIQSHTARPPVTILKVERMRILERIPIRVSGILKAESSWIAVQKVGEVVELQTAAKVSVEYLGNRRAPEFVPELDVVLAALPRNVVNIMPVGIDTMTQGSAAGAQLGERRAAHDHDWKSPVHTGATCVEANARGVKVSVNWFKSFAETVPPQSHFIYDGRS